MRFFPPVHLMVICALTAACMPHYEPPAPAQIRAGTPVSASFGKSWDAVVGFFAERNLAIRTIDRASGLIVAEPQRVGLAPNAADALADCGAMTNGGAHLYATDAVWNVLVRGDSSASTVKATVRFSWVHSAARGHGEAQDGGLANKACESRGVWESQLEQRVKATAERR